MVIDLGLLTKRLLLPVATVGSLGLLGMQAQAATISDSATVPFTLTDWNDSVNLDLFDDEGGTRTLNSVILRLNTQLRGDYEIDAISDTLLRRLEIGATVEATPGVGSTSLFTFANEVIQSLSDSPINIPAGESRTFSITGSGGVISIFDEQTVTTNLNDFIGVGTFSVDLNADSSSTITVGGGNQDLFQFTDAESEVVVTYNFDEAPAIPTPAMLPGLIGMGVAFWRKKVSGDQAEAESEQVISD